jgi:RimJ/RimL family protein N-acetyltransferase
LAWIEWAGNDLDTNHLIVAIHPDNTASSKLATALGFTVDQ